MSNATQSAKARFHVDTGFVPVRRVEDSLQLARRSWLESSAAKLQQRGTAERQPVFVTTQTGLSRPRDQPERLNRPDHGKSRYRKLGILIEHKENKKSSLFGRGKPSVGRQC